MGFKVYGDYYRHGIFHVYPGRNESDSQILLDNVTSNLSRVCVLTVVGRQYAHPHNMEDTKKLVKQCEEFRLQFLDSKSFHFDYHYDEYELLDDPDVVGRKSKKQFRSAAEYL